MQFNTISLCFMVWSAASLLSMCSASLQRYKAKREHELKKIYLIQFIFLAKEGKNTEEILKSLYYFFIEKKKIRLMLLKAMRMSSGAGLEYIYSRIGCEPMNIIHGFVRKREVQGSGRALSSLSESLVSYFYQLIDQWEEDYQQTSRELRKRKIRTLAEIACFVSLNYYLNSWINTEISLLIFIVGNTLGVILFIVLDNQSFVADECYVEGKILGRKRIKRTHFPARGLQSFYQLVSGMGLIVNIFIVVAEWLGPVV